MEQLSIDLPIPSDPFDQRALERFKRYLKVTPDGCWLWTGAHHQRGYGRIRWNGRVRSTHRVAWELARGEPLPDDQIIRHLCHHPACCNPAHLRMGTASMNAADGSGYRRIPITFEECDREINRCKEGISNARESIDRLKKRLSWIKQRRRLFR